MFDPTPQVLKKTEVAVPRKTSVEAERLRAARALIEDKNFWTGKPRSFRDTEDRRLGRMCALEAYGKVCGDGEFIYENVSPALISAAKEVLGRCRRPGWENASAVYAVNDSLGHAVTLAMFDRAIEIAESIPA